LISPTAQLSVAGANPVPLRRNISVSTNFK